MLQHVMLDWVTSWDRQYTTRSLGSRSTTHVHERIDLLRTGNQVATCIITRAPVIVRESRRALTPIGIKIRGV